MTAPDKPSKVRFAWSGAVAGQGWGINPEWGGMRGFDAVRLREPDFFIHSGDTIYADVPLKSEVQLPDGTVWKNVVTEAKSKVAETLAEFRGNFAYNLMDENVRRLQSQVAQIWQWDDHEVMNNWSPGRDLTADNRYREKDILKIAARAKQAFLEYSPIPAVRTFTARSPTDRCWMCSCSTCGPTAPPIATTCSQIVAAQPTTWAVRRSPG